MVRTVLSSGTEVAHAVWTCRGGSEAGAFFDTGGLPALLAGLHPTKTERPARQKMPRALQSILICSRNGMAFQEK
jgi:hypothetical protein